MIRIRGYRWMFEGYKVAALHNLGIACTCGCYHCSDNPAMISAVLLFSHHASRHKHVSFFIIHAFCIAYAKGDVISQVAWHDICV
jgi:hypothetical protein